MSTSVLGLPVMYLILLSHILAMDSWTRNGSTHGHACMTFKHQFLTNRMKNQQQKCIPLLLVRPFAFLYFGAFKCDCKGDLSDYLIMICDRFHMHIIVRGCSGGQVLFF